MKQRSPASRQEFLLTNNGSEDINLSTRKGVSLPASQSLSLIKILTLEKIKIPTFGFPSYSKLKKYRKELIDRATPQEKALMKRLQSERIRFRFQKIIAPYIVDFWFKDLIVELDGSHHIDNFRQINYDSHRDEFLQGFSSYNVMRFLNKDVENGLDFVVATIKENLEIKKRWYRNISYYNSSYNFDRSSFLCETNYFKYLKKFHREFKKRLSRKLRDVFIIKSVV